MRDLFRDYKWDGRPWIILGKGRSFRVPTQEESDTYNIIGLNHTIRETKCIGHIIDIDVLDNLGEKLLECEALFLPYYPHMGWRPHEFLTLEDLCQKHPILKQMQDRVFGYNLSTASTMLNKVWNHSSIVWASFFSAEAVVSLLGKLRVKKIRTLGVDGGKGQAEAFKDLQNINSNGYDAEWKGIRKSVQKFELDYAPLGVESPCRIFIGAGDAQLVPALVLKHSILKHATMSVDVIIMNEWTHPIPKDARNRPRTPFSFQRFMIPEKCGYQGHAIYMDSDMLVFGDVKELWEYRIFGDVVAVLDDDIDKHKAKYSVIIMDCDKVDISINQIVSNLDAGKFTYEDVVFNFNMGASIRSGVSPTWNSLESYTEGKTKLLHYTEMYNQPWLVNPNHPLGYLWFNKLKEAVADGSIDRKLIEEHIAKRWILPKCLEVLSG